MESGPREFLIGAPNCSPGREQEADLGHPGRCSGTRLLNQDAPEAEMFEKRSVGHAVPISVSTNTPLGALILRLEDLRVAVASFQGSYMSHVSEGLQGRC